MNCHESQVKSKGYIELAKDRSAPARPDDRHRICAGPVRQRPGAAGSDFRLEALFTELLEAVMALMGVDSVVAKAAPSKAEAAGAEAQLILLRYGATEVVP